MILLKNYDIYHLCCTEKGSSGSPILNLSINKLIGIHKGASNSFNYNKGTLLIYPFKEFFNQIQQDNNLIKNNKILSNKTKNEIKNNKLINKNIDNNEPEDTNISISQNIVKITEFEYHSNILVTSITDKIKADLINYLNGNINQYINEYILTNHSDKNITNYNIIEQLIINDNIESYYKNIVFDSLIKYYNNHPLIELDHISVIVTGEEGIGKSALINSLLFLEGKKAALEGWLFPRLNEVKEYKSEKIPFLYLTEARGFGLKEDPLYIYESIKNIIKSKNDNEKQDLSNLSFDSENNMLCQEKKGNIILPDNYHCIWYCVHGNINKSIEILKLLQNNNYNIPIIVVYTMSVFKSEIMNAENKIKDLFPDLKFIYVMAKDTQLIRKFGLDELLNLTFDTIKSMKMNDIFKDVIVEYKTRLTNLIKDIICEIKANVINLLEKELIDKDNSFLNEKDLKKFIFSLIEKIISAYSNKKELSLKKKLFLQNYWLKNLAESYNSLSYKFTNNFINNTLEKRIIEYFNMKIKKEEAKIFKKNKEIKEELKKLVIQYYKDEQYHIIREMLLHKLVKDFFVEINEIICQKILDEIDYFLMSDEVMEEYQKIYLKIFQNFELQTNIFRDKNGKIYG